MHLIPQLAIKTFRAFGPQTQERLGELVLHYGKSYGCSQQEIDGHFETAASSLRFNEDVVWVWLDVEWREAHVRAVDAELPSWREIDEHVQALARCGYVAHRGSRSIGAPEGPPSDAELRAVGQ